MIRYKLIKKVLTKKSLKEFDEFMKGQTVNVIEGEIYINDYDFTRWMESRKFTHLDIIMQEMCRIVGAKMD